MRLADFILTNVEPILNDWESFARSIWPEPNVSRLVLRDDAEEILLAIARDMKSPQTDAQQSDKSRGHGEGGDSKRGKISDRVDDVSNLHALGRLSSGFELRELVAEYRALRSSVIHLWSLSLPEPGPYERDDNIRFNEAIDQLLAESVACFVRRVDDSRECFLGILGHDLRSPLAAAILAAHLLAESKELDSRTSQFAGTLCSSLTAMDLLVRDLLDFTGSRLGAKMVVYPGPMDLLGVCGEVLEEIRTLNPSRTFVLESESGGPVLGWWDGARLRQLIGNLLGNAVQHGSATTPVILKVSSAGDHVYLAIHNSGAPIPPEMLGVIFEPMKQHHPSEASRPAGSVGLGLYIACEVASAHGGSIAVFSNTGETVFTVTLPRHPPDMA